MQLRNTLSVTAFAAILAAGDLLQAQQPAAQPGVKVQQPGVQVQVQPRQPAQPGQPGQRAGWPVTEQNLAACIAIENQAEIALSKWATSKAKSQDVKDFADMLASDHAAFLKQLERFTPEARESSAITDQRTTATDEGGRVQPAGGAQPAQPGRIQQTAGQQPAGQQLDMIQLGREIASQCLADAKKGLSEKEGEDFDKCFVGGQLASHAAMHSKLTVLQKRVSPELAQVFKDGLETVKSHQDEAEKLLKQLEKGSKASE